MKPNWNAIRAEYIGGGVSQRELAKKHGVSPTTLMKKANAEGWADLRKDADNRSTAEAQQRTANNAADFAVKKQRLAMLILDAAVDTIEAYKEKGVLKANDIKLLSGVLKDFESTSVAQSTADEPLAAILARWDDASKQ